MRLKSIKDIFKNNQGLLEQDEVKELLDYCESLQAAVIEHEQSVDQSVQLKQLISEIKEGLNDVLEQKGLHERWPSEFDKPDFEQNIINLKQYITDYCKTNKIYL
jgi:molecular chaperone GrpE (heat shock protein)